MHCSSCKPLLDRYLEGTLTPRKMADVRMHLQSCADCRAILDEVKAVDGLLFTTRVPELPENFTFAVMAELGTMPAPRARQHPFWSFLVVYPPAAWVAAIVAFAVTGTSPSVFLNGAGSALAKLGATAAGVNGSLAQSLSHNVPMLAAFGFGVLAIDAVLAALVVAVYFGLRPRLAAMLAASREVSS